MLITSAQLLRPFLNSCKCMKSFKCKRTLTLSKVLREKCHYKTLGLQRGANKKEIRAAYLEKTKLYHPDSNPDDETLHAKFVEVAQAYSVLGNESDKLRYDSGDFAKPYKYGGRRWQDKYTSPNPNEWDEERKRRRVYEHLNKYHRETQNSKEYWERKRQNNPKVFWKIFLFMVIGNILMMSLFRYRHTRLMEQLDKRSGEINISLKEEVRKKKEKKLGDGGHNHQLTDVNEVK